MKEGTYASGPHAVCGSVWPVDLPIRCRDIQNGLGHTHAAGARVLRLAGATLRSELLLFIRAVGV